MGIYDLNVLLGKKERPAIVFIHGLGMDRRIWQSPNEARILAGQFPIHVLLCKKREGLIRTGSGNKDVEPSGNRGRVLLGNPYCKLRTVFHDLKKEGYTLITWSQRRPAATVDIAVNELKDVIELSQVYGLTQFVLIGHSRGGLIGRRYLQRFKDRRVNALITISTPHSGTRMATLIKYISPFATAIKSLVEESERVTTLYILKRLSEFLSSRAVMELLPDSELIKSLDDSTIDGVKYLSIGGSSPSLLCINRISEVVEGKTKRVKLEKILSFPSDIERFIPRRFIPDEIKEGLGDGLVSDESSKMPMADKHYTFHLNHAEILFSKNVRERIISEIKGLSG